MDLSNYVFQTYIYPAYSQIREYISISEISLILGQGLLHMCSSFSLKIVTANDLIDGDVVYLSADNHWVRHQRDAELLMDAEHTAARLRFAEAQHAHVVGAYLADVNAGPSGPIPAHFREVFRARGPSNYFHGKQSEQANVSV